MNRVNRPLDHSTIVSRLEKLRSESQEDGGCLKYLFLNNENHDTCLPPYLWINETQFGKKSNATF